MRGRKSTASSEENALDTSTSEATASNSEVLNLGNDLKIIASSNEGVDQEVFIDFEKKEATEVTPSAKPVKDAKESSFRKFWKRRKSVPERSVTTDAKPMVAPMPTPPQRGYVVPVTPTAVMPLSEDATEYNMSHPRRGKAVIFSHDRFDQRRLPRRDGTKLDEARLEKTLKMLDFEVKIHRNKTLSKIQKKIEKLSEEDHSDCDCLFVAVLTHGGVNQIYAKDKEYSSELLWRPFGGDRCPSLAGKPKIFIIQACRGKGMDLGVLLQPCSYVQSGPIGYQSYMIPSMSDFIIGYASFPGFVSIRNTVDGSWYIQSLCEILEQQHHNLDLHRMLTRAAHKVAVKCNCEYGKQAPTIMSTLIRDVYFTPKNAALN